MVTGRTLFSHRYIHKETWHGTDDRTVNQINQVRMYWMLEVIEVLMLIHITI
jgi:hypothetical protein